MAAVTLAVPVGDEMDSVRSSGLSMREYHLSVFTSLVKKDSCSSLFALSSTDSFSALWPS